MGYYDFMKEKSNVDLNFMIERLRTFNKYEHIKKDCFSLCISICVENDPVLGPINCIKITYTSNTHTVVRYFKPYDLLEVVTEFRNRLMHNPAIPINDGCSLADIKESNQQVSKEISGRDKLVHEINRDTVFKSLCVNGSFTYRHGSSCYSSIDLYDLYLETEVVNRKLMITFVNQINEEVYTRFIPIKGFEFGIDVFLKLLKTNEVYFNINND